MCFSAGWCKWCLSRKQNHFLSIRFNCPIKLTHTPLRYKLGVIIMATHVEHTVLEATTDAEIISLHPVLRELRPHIVTEQQLLEICRLTIDKENCHYAYIKDVLPGETEAKPVSVLSYRVLHCLFYGRQMYVNDVITLPTAKKRGYAGALMDYAIAKAKEDKCNVVTLDSGYTRKDAHRFYLNKRFNMTCHHFTLDIDPIGKH